MLEVCADFLRLIVCLDPGGLSRLSSTDRVFGCWRSMLDDRNTEGLRWILRLIVEILQVYVGFFKLMTGQICEFLSRGWWVVCEISHVFICLALKKIMFCFCLSNVLILCLVVCFLCWIDVLYWARFTKHWVYNFCNYVDDTVGICCDIILVPILT